MLNNIQADLRQSHTAELDMFEWTMWNFFSENKVHKANVVWNSKSHWVQFTEFMVDKITDARLTWSFFQCPIEVFQLLLLKNLHDFSTLKSFFVSLTFYFVSYSLCVLHTKFKFCRLSIISIRLCSHRKCTRRLQHSHWFRSETNYESDKFPRHRLNEFGHKKCAYLIKSNGQFYLEWFLTRLSTLMIGI